MTVQKELTKNIYVGNGATNVFPFTFECPEEHPEYIRVYVANDRGILQETKNFAVNMSTKNIKYPASGTLLGEGKKLVVRRLLPLKQLMNLINNGTYFAEDVETSFDECIMLIQQLSEQLGRTLMMTADANENFNNEIPIVPGKSFKINADGTGIELMDPHTGLSDEDIKRFLREILPEIGLAFDIDDTLSNTSVNPVQNKVITTALGNVVIDVEKIKTLIKNGAVGGNGVITFNTMADLKMVGVESLKAGNEFKLLGYYKAYDGGGANYICKYLWSAAAYPWAVDLGETEELEYKLVYKLDGTPEIDPETGEYVILKDAKGNPVPVYEADGVAQKHKHLYALITDTVVNYAMFGAKLDGETDDYTAIYMAHKYQHDNYTIEPMSGRRRYYIKVENHKGIIRKDNDEPITCSGNIDLSGSQLLIQDCNATWFGFYLWGDNEEDYMTYEPLADVRSTFVKDNFVINSKGNEGSVRPNSLISFREDPYAVRDDGGYLYSAPRYELLLHTADGVLANPFTEDWDKAGGMEISAPFSDYTTHEIRTETLISHFTTSYTRLPTTHYYFTGCEVKLATTANKYCSVLWCKCHNAHIKGFTFEVDSTQLHNTVFKNTMIYLWGAYNVELSDIVGFNAAGKMDGGINGTSGYVFRATNCLNLNIHDISVQGYWGATAMNCVKNIHLTRVNINRLDIHNYFYNLFIDNCNLYNHSIQIGEGRGICQITNSNFYVNNLEGDSYPNAHILEFNLTYGRIFEGKVLIENCNAFIKDANGDEFDVCKIDFSPEAVSTLAHYKFPEVTIRNCHFYAYNPDTYLVYFMVAGTRNCKTSTKAPTNIKDYCRDTGNDDTGSLMWKYIGRGVDWVDNGNESSARLNVIKGQIIRTYDKYLNSDSKSVFYNVHYFVVTAAGTLPVPKEDNKPDDYSGNEFSVGNGQTACKLKCVTDYRWEASKQYSKGDYCFTESSYFLPVICYECTAGGKSNGYRPVHTEGTVIEGVDVYPKNLDACWWEYVKPMDEFVTVTFTPNMTVKSGDILYVSGRLYDVFQGGKLKDAPPLDTTWNGSFTEGSARLGFIGKDWAAKTWWAQGSYCISTAAGGVRNVYRLVDQDGTTSGSIPVQGNARTVDGDIIWENDDSVSATKGAWQAQTQYDVGDVVYNAGHNYKCIFDGRLELPHQTVIEDVSTNMTGGGDVFSFYGDTDVPTKFNNRGKWVIKVDNVEHYRFPEFTNGYFGHEGNPQPTIIEAGTGSSNVEIYAGDYSVTPQADSEQELSTAQKFLEDNITVEKIPYTEVSNTSDGVTVYIGKDVE